MKTLLNIIKSIFPIHEWFCKHEYKFVKNIYGDEINLLGGRSEWVCTRCGKWKVEQNLNEITS